MNHVTSFQISLFFFKGTKKSSHTIVSFILQDFFSPILLCFFWVRQRWKKTPFLTPLQALDHKMDDLSEGEVAEALGARPMGWLFWCRTLFKENGGPDGSEIFHSCLVGSCTYAMVLSNCHQEFQVPKMEVLNLIRLFWGWVFPYISLTYSLYRWVPPF